MGGKQGNEDGPMARLTEKGIAGLIAVLLCVIGFFLVMGINTVQSQESELRAVTATNAKEINKTKERVTRIEVQYEYINHQLDSIGKTQREILKEIRNK
jgi:cell division protein FtsB